MGVFEYDFSVKNCDVARAMKVGRIAHTILPSLLPHLITKVELLQGDGGAGTIKAISINPAATGGEAKTMTQHVTVFDEATGTAAWEEEDPRFSKPVVHTLTMKDEGSDVRMYWTMQFEPVDPATPPPEDLRMITVEFFNSLTAHVEAHPRLALTTPAAASLGSPACATRPWLEWLPEMEVCGECVSSRRSCEGVKQRSGRNVLVSSHL